MDDRNPKCYCPVGNVQLMYNPIRSGIPLLLKSKLDPFKGRANQLVVWLLSDEMIFISPGSLEIHILGRKHPYLGVPSNTWRNI